MLEEVNGYDPVRPCGNQYKDESDFESVRSLTTNLAFIIIGDLYCFLNTHFSMRNSAEFWYATWYTISARKVSHPIS